jgi:TonB family protein
LPSWTNFDVLAPTTIQVLVGEDGDVISASLQPPGSGVAAADQYAMQAARLLRFNPVQPAPNSPALSWGSVDFLWHTAAPEAARSAGGPPP